MVRMVCSGGKPSRRAAGFIHQGLPLTWGHAVAGAERPTEVRRADEPASLNHLTDALTATIADFCS